MLLTKGIGFMNVTLFLLTEEIFFQRVGENYILRWNFLPKINWIKPQMLNKA